MGIRTTTAAELLGVSASTLRTWERRYGFPMPRRSEGGHRLYDRADIAALRDAYAETGHAASAVELARGRGAAPASCLHLHAALHAFDEDAADAVCHEALAARSVERVVEEVLLDGIDSLADGSPEHALGLRWGAGWIAAQRRLAAPAVLQDGVLVLDADGPDRLHVAALELVLRRAGLRVLVLPIRLDPTRLQRAITALDPSLVVLGGRGAGLEEVGRAVFTARRSRGERLAVCDFRGATGSLSTVPSVGPRLQDARQRVLDLLASTDIGRDVPDVVPQLQRSPLRAAR